MKVVKEKINSWNLPELSGVPSQTLREWRKRGLIPKEKLIDARWVKVVRDVYQSNRSLACLFSKALVGCGLADKEDFLFQIEIRRRTDGTACAHVGAIAPFVVWPEEFLNDGLDEDQRQQRLLDIIGQVVKTKQITFVLLVALGVCVMSPMRIGNAYARNLAKAPDVQTSTVVKIDPVKDWPNTRQLALMRVRRIPYVQQVVAQLERSTVRAKSNDWRWLVDSRLVTVDKVKGWQATHEGARIAETLAWHYAGELRMHIFKPSGGEWHSASTLCSCGWRGNVPTGAHTQARIYAAQAHHLSQVEDGSFKPIGDQLEKIFNRVKDG